MNIEEKLALKALNGLMRYFTFIVRKYSNKFCKFLISFSLSLFTFDGINCSILLS